jgi:hypothetical protein
MEVVESDGTQAITPVVGPSSMAFAWTAESQQCLDIALAANPKLDGEDAKTRWGRIASMVPGKSLRECVERYKEIRENLQAAVANRDAEALAITAPMLVLPTERKGSIVIASSILKQPTKLPNEERGWGIAMVDEDAPNSGWWKQIDTDDPISLEPIRDLRYPPFELTTKSMCIKIL